MSFSASSLKISWITAFIIIFQIYLKCDCLRCNKNVQVLLKSVLVAELLLRNTSVEGSTWADIVISSHILPNEKSCITKTCCYCNCCLYYKIMQAQPKFHQKLTSESKSSASRIWKHESGWRKRHFLSFPLYPALTQTRQMESEKARDVIIPFSR